MFDLIGACCSLLSTYYFIRLNKKAWLVGIFATCINGGLYWYKGIYADTLLEVFYFFTMLYGWYKWNGGVVGHKQSVPNELKTLAPMQWLLLLFGLGVVFVIIYYLLDTFTDSSVAMLDAGTTALSIVAQWLMCQKIIATWILWFITDSFYIVMYLSKQLPFHSVLMGIYTILAVSGYVIWSRKQRVNFEQGQRKTILNAI